MWSQHTKGLDLLKGSDAARDEYYGGAMKQKRKAVRGPLLAIDIGTHRIKFAVGQLSGGNLKVSTLVEVDTPPGGIVNGMVADEAMLKSIILDTIHAHKIRVKNVTVCIDNPEIVKREMVVPKVDTADQLELITYEIGQYLPIDVSTYVVQYKALETIVENDTEKLKILMVAVPRDMAKKLHDLVEECGLRPMFLDLHTNAMEKLIAVNANVSEQAVAIIDFGHAQIDVALFEGGVYRFNRLIKRGMAALDGEMMSTLDDVSVDYLNTSIEEIEKIFKYYATRGMNNAIDAVYLCGGGAQVQGMRAYMDERLGAPVKDFDALKGFDLPPAIRPEDLGVYVYALGALIRR